MSFASIFSRSVACLLILLILAVGEQEFLILMKSSLSVLSSMDRAFGVMSKKALPNPESSRFSRVLSAGSFITVHFTLRSRCRCAGWKVCVWTAASACGCPVVPVPFVRETVFSPVSLSLLC